jgi:F0F1-type ATP synthase delta subunit
MFQLKTYVEAIVELLETAKDEREKKELIDSWFAVLKKHYRDSELDKIRNIIGEMALDSQERAEVTTAGEEEKKKLKAAFSQEKIPVQWEMDPQEIGGARIIYKNKLIDNTVKTQLARLASRLAESE